METACPVRSGRIPPDGTNRSPAAVRERWRGKSLAIACPKLDSNTQTYVGKLTEMIDGAKINTLTVLVMEVPCCRGLVQIARQARGKARRHIPVKTVVLSAGGEVIDDQWI